MLLKQSMENFHLMRDWCLLGDSKFNLQYFDWAMCPFFECISECSARNKNARPPHAHPSWHRNHIGPLVWTRDDWAGWILDWRYALEVSHFSLPGLYQIPKQRLKQIHSNPFKHLWRTFSSQPVALGGEQFLNHQANLLGLLRPI